MYFPYIIVCFLALFSVTSLSNNVYSKQSFDSPTSVKNAINEINQSQLNGKLTSYYDWKQSFYLENELSFGLDSIFYYINSPTLQTNHTASSNVTRLFGTWQPKSIQSNGQKELVFKVESRQAILATPSAQALGPINGYVGLLASTYSDAGLVLTNLYWKHYIDDKDVAFVIGQVDTYDYTNVNSLANPWTAFTNLAFQQQGTFAGPSQGLGAALNWRFDDNWSLLFGAADANGDATKPLNVSSLVNDFELFKHLAIGFIPKWDERYDQHVQFTFWHKDAQQSLDVEEDYGISFVTSIKVENYQSFVRASIAKGSSTLLKQALSTGISFNQPNNGLVGIAIGWGKAESYSKNQYEAEAFYRFDIGSFLQITPSIHYVINPLENEEQEDILFFGIRTRIYF